MYIQMRVSLKYVLIYMYTHIYPHSINMVCMNIFKVFTQTFAEFKHEKITTTETNFLSSPSVYISLSQDTAYI